MNTTTENRRFFTSEGPFLGRESELNRLRRLVSERSLILVHGPPGAGKSRLVAEAMGRRGGDAPRVVWCRMASVRTEIDMLATIERSLGLERAGDATAGSGAARIENAVNREPCILVVDDFDALTTHLDRLRRWSDVPGVTVIVTSRARPGRGDDVALHVGPLETDVSVRLFEDRAQRFAEARLPADSGADIRRLVEALDGLPYAIELAAGRAGLMSPGEMLHRLDERFQLLRSRRTDETEAMDRTLDWTWQFLDDVERRCLAPCVALPGPIGFESLDAIVDLPEGVNLYDIIEGLLRKNWLMREVDEARARPRFRVLNTIRAFARLRLDLAETEGRAARHYARFVREKAAHVISPGGRDVLAELENAARNLRWALDYWLEREERPALQLMRDLRWPALLHGPLFQYTGLLDRTIALARQLNEAEARADLLELRAQLNLLAGDAEGALMSIEEAETVSRSVDDALRSRIGRTHGLLLSSRQPSAALERLGRALSDAKKGGGEFMAARIHERIGYTHLRAFELVAAEEAFGAAVDAFERAGTPWFAADAFAGLAYVAHRKGRIGEAVRRFGRAEEFRRGHRATNLHAGAAFNLGVALHACGRLEEASRRLSDALEEWKRLGSDRYLPMVRCRLGMLRHEMGSPSQARELLRSAAETGAEHGDAQSQAIAVGYLAVMDFLKNGDCSLQDLETTFATMTTGADPDAASAFAVVELAVGGGDDERTAINRIEELRALLSAQDTYYAEILDLLHGVGRALAALREATSTPDGHHRQARQLEAVESIRSVIETSSPDGARDAIADIPSHWVRILARHLLDEAARTGVDPWDHEVSEEPVLSVHANCHWYRFGDAEPVDLAAKKPTRLLLKFILQRHLDDPSAACGMEELIAAGWPGESMTYESGRNRVYAAIRFLREHQLDDVIETGDEGYRVASGVQVRVAPTTGLRVPDR